MTTAGTSSGRLVALPIAHRGVAREVVRPLALAARAGCVVSFLALAVACSPYSSSQPSVGAAAVSSSIDAPWALSVAPASLPTAVDSGEPQLTVSTRGVLASWVEAKPTGFVLRYAERTDGAWGAARTASSGSDWFLSWADVPSVLRLRDGSLVAQWLENVDASIEAYDVKLSVSKNDGASWSAAVSPHRDGTRTQHGFVSLFEWPDGPTVAPRGLGLVWLDGRDQELSTDSSGGSMTLMSGTLSPQLTGSAEQPVNTRVCECCPTSVAVSADGVIAAFRDRSVEEVRDIYVSRFSSGAWGEPVLVHADNWKIDACPVNGPAISVAGRRAAVAWFSAPGDKGHAYVAFSEDAGRTWGYPRRVDSETALGHVDVELLDDGSAAVSWVEFADGRGRFAVRRINPEGTRSQIVWVGGDGAARVSGNPRMARNGSELVFVWAESGGGKADALARLRTQVMGAIARIPHE